MTYEGTGKSTGAKQRKRPIGTADSCGGRIFRELQKTGDDAFQAIEPKGEQARGGSITLNSKRGETEGKKKWRRHESPSSEGGENSSPKLPSSHTCGRVAQ